MTAWLCGHAIGAGVDRAIGVAEAAEMVVIDGVVETPMTEGFEAHFWALTP